MQPHMNDVMISLKEVETHFNGTIRWHVSEAYMQIAFGLLRLHTGNPDSEEKFNWEKGLPAKPSLPAPVL